MKNFLIIGFVLLSLASYSQRKRLKPYLQRKPVSFNSQRKQIAILSQKNKKDSTIIKETKPMEENEISTLGAGCFWCVEAVFQRLDGVIKVESGYMGGKSANPTYKDVCTGTTGHAEVCQITYNSTKITFEEILEIFWKTHDPTTLNRQGNDVGTQYRSAIFYHNDKQKEISQKYIKDLNSSGVFDHPVVTTIEAASKFYVAENYHQDYFNLNGSQPYCQFVVKPKVEKFEKVFKDRLKKGM
jgi:peptide-methionine (S)-S-oxide reductase